MQSYAEQFRQAAEARLAGKRSPGRYPNQLRDLALSHLAEVRRDGGKASRAARELDIDANTLRGWEKMSRQRTLHRGAVGALVPVVVNRAHESVTDAGPAFVVHGPHGLTVDCRAASDVAALVHALA
jgi:transposase-like protein